MYFTDIFIRRPVFACVLSLILFLVGLRCFFALPVRQYPSIEPSVINVNTSYSGASAKLIESFVTTPLENALSAVQGIDFMHSSSTQGESNVTIHFLLGTEINTAMADVTNAVSSIRSRLPHDIDDPIVAKKDPEANPTIYLSFSSNTTTPEAIGDYLVRVVQPQMQTLPGVGQAQILNRRQYAMRLWLDPKRMAAQNITATDVINALNKNNVQAAPGALRSPYLQVAINAKTDLNSVEQFNNLVLQNNNGYLTRLRDVGYATLGPVDDSVSVNVNGIKNAIVLGVIPQPTANPLDISKEVNALLPEVRAALPPGIEVLVGWDSSKFIAASLKEVRKTFIEAILFVVLVIFLFLGSARAVFIPVITIPLSIVGVCAIMLLLGYTINTLTLLAWVLAIGLVVDDAIVVLENIHRHIELGEKPFNAAIIGTREISFAIVAMTITLAAVYAPIGFLPDVTGRLFREFAFTLAGAVIVSGFVALTLSPMMCSKFLTHDLNKKGLVATVDDLFNKLMVKYRWLLQNILTHRNIVLFFGAIIYISCYFLYTSLPSELAPTEDQGAIMTISSGPTSANLPYIEKYTSQLQKIYEGVPDKNNYIILNGFPSSNGALSFLVLKPWDERDRSVNQIIQSLFPSLWGITGITAFPVNLPPLPGSSGRTPVEFVLKTTGSYEDLYASVQKLLGAASQNRGLMNVDTDLKLNKPQITMTIDRNKASSMGISASDISTTLNTLIGEPTASHFEMSGRSYDIIPQLYREYMQYPEQLNNINFRTTGGALVPLSNLVKIEFGTSPQSLNHFQQLRSATVSASLVPGYTQGQALDFLRTKAEELLPKNIQYDYSGQLRQFVQASGGMEQTLLFAVIFIYLVLAAQFESFLDPLIVMMSVPLSITGALLTIHLVGGTLNIYTQIGLVTLIGLISKHGILIVEFANQQQENGLSIFDAVIEAASLRLRPILMTTGAMLLGGLPLILASGAGAASRQQLGWTIFGGMGFGTLFTVFLVPVAYTFLATHKKIHTTSETGVSNADQPLTNSH